ncbi:hypothetical protein TCDM_13552 [Trypanosoma cruzi Dm28c]|uniref:Uncharacterized protein n=1 Tax=Trypanosoma cruzi Dm28c TaxID=1416333 RepID=V5AIC7_TRYCR|nr:hypothetical protein TCDM_13552 [Trypanosoma cruzi Dm28c]
MNTEIKKEKHAKQTKPKKTTRRQGVWLCVWRCGCLPALTAKKTKQEGKKCVLRPTGPRRTPTRHGSLSAPFVAALLTRAAGEAHRAIVTSVSVGVRVELLGGNTRHPSQEECSNKQLKREE